LDFQQIKNKFQARCLLKEHLLVFLSALYLVFFTNKTLIHFIINVEYGSSTEGFLFKLSTLVLAVILMCIVLLIFYALNLTKPTIIFFVFIAAASDFFMGEYGVLIDGPTIQSVFETTKTEASQYFSWGIFFALVLYALLFSLLVLWVKIEKPNWRRRILNTLKYFALCLGLIALIGVFFYKDYAAFFRSNRYVRHMYNPVNSIYETFRHFQAEFFPKDTSLQPIGMDAQRVNVKPHQRKRLVVFVLGETARGDHFSLNGYGPETNPQMKKEDVISYKDVSSCGTATATSVPCVFSHFGRKGFDPSRSDNYENLLDIVQRAGYKTTWVDNNTGCKGVCARVNNIELTPYVDKEICNQGGCFDDILLKPLKVLAEDKSVDQFVILHTLGSHGPTYYLRYPKPFAVFQPECLTNQLIDCTREQVINTYDNTILYTDHVLGGVVDFLKSMGPEYDTAMIYVSDHGASLGENGIYLHSLPYSIAPEEQKKVAFILWMSDSFMESKGLTKSALKKNQNCHLSHDNVFHTFLGLLDVQTKEYKPEFNVLEKNIPCAE
jgi:lipid A ethanolaminephosphotransferase